MSDDVCDLSVGIGCYILVSYFLVKSFKYEGMGVVNILWSAFSVTSVVLVGVLAFDEKVDMKEVAGILFVLGGLVLLRISEHHKSKRGGQCLHVHISDVPSLSK